jgi:hypothetical protein
MFGRWLALVRQGPNLLRATTLGADPSVATPGECGAPPGPDSGVLSSSDAPALVPPGNQQRPDTKPWRRSASQDMCSPG